MQLRKLVFGLVFLLCSFQGQAQRLAGYLPSYTASFAQTQFTKMTDVIFCFINPDASGTGALVLDRVGNANFDFEMEKFQIVKSKCYPMTDNGPKLWIALGGADPGNTRSARIAGLCATAAGRTNLANTLVAFAIKHDLEGIDIDWEFPSAGAQATNYGQFVVELRVRINASSNTALKISVAVGGETIGGCGSGHLPYFDFSVAGAVAAVDYFNIMTYDLPAGYNNNHSTLANGNTSLNEWSSCKTIPKSKLLMGVPFYGRNAGRSAIQNYKAMGAGANAGDNVGGTYYYNGDATIAAKIDAVRATHNAAGIMIWDVDMDKAHSTGESLLSGAFTKMFGNAASNPCSTRPYMGKDTTLCVGQSLLLNPVVNSTSAAGARTFAWTVNGSPTGGNTNTLSVTTAGTYKVTVTQAPTGCVLTDEIIISEQAEVTTPTAAPNNYVCSSGVSSATLSSTSSGTIEWYTAATGGAKIATGTSTVVRPTVTTTYYAEASTVPTNKKYYAGRGAIASNALWMERTRNATQTTRPEWVQQFTVQQTLTLKSVVVYFKSNATNNPVQIYVMDATIPGNTTMATVPTQVSANTTASINLPARSGTEPWGVYPVIVPVNITFQPGIYYVGVFSSNGDPSLFGQGAGLETAISQLSSAAGVYSIGATAHQNYGGGYGVAGTHYGQLFDWRIESGALSQCMRKSIVITHDCTLPVELVNFTGVRQEQQNFLTWNTASERNNHYFMIERSVDGIQFSSIGKVDGHGTTAEGSYYTFVDQDPIEGINYYRLAQYDVDGTIHYSAVVAISHDDATQYQVSPNPFVDEVTINTHASDTRKTLQVVNVQGIVIAQYDIEAGASCIRVGRDFNPGIYILKIQDGNAQSVFKVIKK